MTSAPVEKGIAVFKAGQKAHTFDLFVQTLRHTPLNELAWLRVSTIFIDKAEQRYCLDRVLESNPNNTAQQGLQTFAVDIVPQAPFVTEQAKAARWLRKD